MMRKQGGYVLLQVMLVFSLLVIVAAKMQYEQRIHIERTRQSLFLSQAQAYAESAEAIAKVGLVLDGQNTENDHLFELWNVTDGMFPLDENSLIEMELSDLQGRFNLNWLAKQQSERAAAHLTLKRLLTIIDSPPEIADELLDWFDSDSGIDYLYADEQPSYAPSYREMADVSELLLLKSVDMAEYKSIKAYFSALPFDTLLNINTSPVALLQSLAPFIDQASAEEMVDRRGEDGYKSIDEFTRADIFKNNQKDNQEKDKELVWKQIGITSDWFELYTAVTLVERTLSQRAILHRSSTQEVTLTSRDRSATEANPIPDDPSKTEEVE